MSNAVNTFYVSHIARLQLSLTAEDDGRSEDVKTEANRMRLYRRGQQGVPPAQKEAAKQILAARVQAGMRVGDSVDARLSWVLTFLQRDLGTLSAGDWLNLCDEIRTYGSPLSLGWSGFYVIDVPKGRTVEEMQRYALLSRAEVQQAHGKR
jgi:hypothetical protein